MPPPTADPFREIAAQTQDFVGTADASGAILWLNEAGRRMTGTPLSADITTMSLADLHPPGEVRKFTEEVFPAIAGGGTWRGEGWVRPRTGADVPVSQMVMAHAPRPDGRQIYSAIFRDVSEQVASRAALSDINARLNLALSLGGIGTGILDLSDLSCDLDERFRDLFGLPMEGRLTANQLVARLSPQDGAMVLQRIGAFTGGDEPGVGAIEVGAHVPGRGDRRFEFEAHVYERGLDGTPTKLIGVLRDVTDEWRREEGLRLLNRELRHRVKNLFAVAKGLIAIGARGETDVLVFASKLRERLDALGRAHTVATAPEEYAPVLLTDLVAGVLGPYEGADVAAPADARLSVPRQAVTPLSLVLHELATNAMKHGALGQGGRVAVEWRMIGDDVELTWTETGTGGGAAANGLDSPKGGFGTVLIDQSMRQLGGSAERTMRPDGLRAVLRFPVRGPEAVA